MTYSALAALSLALLQLTRAQDTNVATVVAGLTSAKIIPDVVPSFTPRFPLEVVFTDKSGSTFPVTAGANLTVNQTAAIPTFALLSNNSAIVGKPYLLAIVDPDAPTPQNPNVSEFRHFLAADYVSNANTNGEFVLANQSKIAPLTEYIGPAPPAGSPAHRYAVLCYLQSAAGVTPPAGFNASNRLSFNLTNFVNSVQGNNLTLVAATFFMVSPTDTTGSVAPNSSNGGPVASATPPSSDASNLAPAAAWAVLAAATALLL